MNKNLHSSNKDVDSEPPYLYQCPGCWGYGEFARPISKKHGEGWIECHGCGERMTRIDLRAPEQHLHRFPVDTQVCVCGTTAKDFYDHPSTFREEIIRAYEDHTITRSELLAALYPLRTDA